MADDCERKVVELITAALSGDSTGYAVGAQETAVAIEQELLQEFGSSSNREFRAKVRSIVFNLKDPKNEQIRHNLLSGTLKVDIFTHMSTKELANPDKQAEWHKLEEKALEETIIQKLPPGEESNHVKRIEFLTLVGRLDDQEQATHPPPDQHHQMMQSM